MKKRLFLPDHHDVPSLHILPVLVGLVLLLTACGPVKKYAGPYLPDEDIAIIQPDEKMFTHVEILGIDKLALDVDESRIAVLPGRHVLFVEAAMDYPFLHKHLYFNQYLVFDAEAGQVYTIHSTILPMQDAGFSWITSDKDPEKIIVKKYAVVVVPVPTYP